jgi:hypothetical protein
VNRPPASAHRPPSRQPASAAATASPSFAATPDRREVPLYPSRWPPPLHWRYAVHRASGEGTATWDWEPGADRYDSRLRVQAQDGTLWFEGTSRGSLAPTGPSPVRHTDRRGGRGEQAADFDAGSGAVRYSGRTAPADLARGTQDRVSWLAQLAGILAAQPGRWAEGDEIVLVVAGARSEAELWRLVVQGRESVALGDGSRVEALKVRRDPDRPYATRVEAWLDPARGFAPVRASWRNGDAFTELVLQP